MLRNGLLQRRLRCRQLSVRCGIELCRENSKLPGVHSRLLLHSHPLLCLTHFKSYFVDLACKSSFRADADTFGDRCLIVDADISRLVR